MKFMLILLVEVLMFENFDLSTVATLIDVYAFEALLNEVGYDRERSQFLINGFKNGFDLKYSGPRNITRTALNLKFTIGNKIELWNKVMKEVQLGRYAGPYKKPPFKNFVQSPIGLVPKDGGQKTRLIFHLSYPRESGTSVNAFTPRELCTVKYKDFDDAVRMCIHEGRHCKVGKTDLTSAFRILGIRPQDWHLLVMKAECPLDGKIYYFVNKCLPFGHAISCSLFQEVSNALSYIVMKQSGKTNVNYLDDFLFAALYKLWCDNQLRLFIETCNRIRFPVSAEKTVWGTSRIVFLGLLIDTVLQLVGIPLEKIKKLTELLETAISRRSMRLKELQSLCGHLNFICKAVIPGRAFTRRLYFATASKKVEKKLRPYHHININKSMRQDMRMWLEFLSLAGIYNRPFLDLSNDVTATQIFWYTDAAKGESRGCGGVCEKRWFAIKWPRGFIKDFDPSIAFLELYAVAVSILHWIKFYVNRRIVLFCDNISVVYMLNRNTSNCKFCLSLIRIIVLESMKYNVRVFANYVNTKANLLADSLSRGKFAEFHALTQGTYVNGNEGVPDQLWPISKIFHQS